MKNILKGFLCVALCLALAFSFCACGKNAELTEENVTKTVETVNTALAEFDTKTLKKYVSSSTLSMIISYAEDKEQFQQLGKAMFENLTMEVESIDLEAKTVTVHITNKKMDNAANAFVSDLLDKYTKLQLLTSLKDDAFLDENLTILLEKIDLCVLTVDETATLKIDKDSKNLVLVFDEESENIVSGGVVKAISSISSN